MAAFIGSELWEKPAHRVKAQAEQSLKSNFGDRLMVWSEMSRVLLDKGVPAEYLQMYCSQSLGHFHELLNLFNAEIRECLTSGEIPILDTAEFDHCAQETPQIAIRDHRILNQDSSIRRAEIQKILLVAWNEREG